MDRRGSSPRRSMKSHLCLPRLNRGGGANPKSHRLSPMTLLERFREAVFRLMMMSALSKSNSGSTTSNVVVASEDVNVVRTKRPCSCYNPADQYHSEAVADCIEFIKRSSALSVEDDEEEEEDEGRREPGGAVVDRSTTNPDMVLPVPVM